jgi:hypothetical protein
MMAEHLTSKLSWHELIFRTLSEPVRSTRTCNASFLLALGTLSLDIKG